MNRKLKQLCKQVYYYVPECLKGRVQDYAEKQKLKEAKAKYLRTKVSKEEVINKLGSLSLHTDIFLHSSMMNIGKIVGGTKFVAKSILEAVDLNAHTLLVSALPYRGRFKDYLESSPVFDVRNADVAMGGINEYIASLPEAKRSIHPTHSVVAVGKDAERYVQFHELDNTPFGIHSPYYKIIQNGGYMLMFGAGMEYITALHAVEDMVGFPFPVQYYYKKTYRVKCIDEKGTELWVDTVCHAPKASIFRSAAILQQEMDKRNQIRHIPIGEAEILYFSAKTMALTYLDLLRNEQSIYGRIKVDEDLLSRINHIIINLNK